MKCSFQRVFITVVITILIPFTAKAGGALNIAADGTPAAWDNSVTITYHPEDGTCGPFSNSYMLQKFTDDLATWSSLEEVDFSFEQVTGQLGQVGIDNYHDYLYLGDGTDDALLTDAINPIIFDDDAEITAELLGTENQYVVLGFAVADYFSDDGSQILDGESVINCRCLADHVSGPCYVNNSQDIIEYSETDLDFTITHEMGHFLNLDHSQVNLDFFNNGDASDDVDIPIMFPYAFETSSGLIARQDDIVALGSIYPSNHFTNNYCTITGTIKDSSGEDLECVDVWATDGTDANTVGYVTGNHAVAADANSDGDAVDPDECTSDCGKFYLSLVPGVSYTLTAKPIDSSMTGGSSVGPCANEQNSTITEAELIVLDANVCQAGQSYDVGSFTLDATDGAGTTATGGSGTGVANGYDPDLNPVGYGCSLENNFVLSANARAEFALLAFALSFLLAFRVGSPYKIHP